MSDIYLLIEGKQEGPYTAEQVRQSLAEGLIPSDLPAWHDGLLGEWVPISSIVEVDLQPLPLTNPPPLPVVALLDNTQPRIEVTATKTGNKFLLTGIISGLIIGVGLFLIVITGLSHRTHTAASGATQAPDGGQRIHLSADSVIGTYSGSDQWNNPVTVQFNKDYTYSFTTKSSLNPPPVNGHWKIDTTTKNNDYLRLLSAMNLEMYDLDPDVTHPGTFVDSLSHVSISKANSDASARTATASPASETKPTAAPSASNIVTTPSAAGDTTTPTTGSSATPTTPNNADSPLAGFEGDYTGQTESYNVMGKDGNNVVYNGRTLSVPSVAVEVVVNKNSLKLKQVAEGSTEVLEEMNSGKLEVTDSNQNSITVAGDFKQDANSDVHYTFTFSKDGTAKMLPAVGVSEPTTKLIDKGINSRQASSTAATPATNASPPPASVDVAAQDDYDHQWQKQLSSFLQPIFDQALASKGLWQREDRWNNPDNLVTWQLFHGIEPGNHARLMLGVTDQARRIPQESTECKGTWEWSLPPDGGQPLVIVRFDPSFAPTKEKGVITESPFAWLADNLSDKDFLDLLRKIDALKISFMAKNNLLSDNSYEVNVDDNRRPHLLLKQVGFRKIDKEDALSLYDLALGGRADLIEKRVPTQEQINDIHSAPLPLIAASMLSQSVLTAESLQKGQADITLEFSPTESTSVGQVIKEFFHTNDDMDKTPRGIANSFIYYNGTDAGNPMQRLFLGSKDNHYIGSFRRKTGRAVDVGSGWDAVKPSDLTATIYTAGFPALTAYIQSSQGFGGVMPSWINEGGYWIQLESPSSGLFLILSYSTDPEPTIIALTNQALDKAEDISKKAVENKINNITKTYQVTDGTTTFDCSLQLYPDPTGWVLKIKNQAGYLYDLERISDFNGDIKYSTLRWAINNATNISRQARAASNNATSSAGSSEKIKAVLAPTFSISSSFWSDLANKFRQTYAHYLTSVRVGSPIINKDTGIAYYPIPSSQNGYVWFVKLTPKESLDGDMDVNTRDYSIQTEVIRCKSNEPDPSKGETLYEFRAWSDGWHKDAALPFFYFAQAAKSTGARDVKELYNTQFPLYNGCQVTADGQILFNPDPVPPYLANSDAGNSTPPHYINAEEIPVFYLLTNKEIQDKIVAAYRVQLKAIMQSRLDNKLKKLN